MSEMDENDVVSTGRNYQLEDSANSRRNEKSKRKQKLSNETQRLLLMRSDLNHENRSLKKRIVSLETQVYKKAFQHV